MITINDNYHFLDTGLQLFKLRGFCISELALCGKLEILFQKGIGITLTWKIIDLYKEKIIKNRQGYIKDNIGNLEIYLHFFEKKPEKRMVIIYINNMNKQMNYSELYHFSKKIYQNLRLNAFTPYLKNTCDQMVKIPKAKGIIGVFIIDKAGFLYFSKVNKNRPIMADHDFQIAGFISAILIYSQDFIGGNEYGLKLEDINLGNCQIILKTKSDVIFAYVVEIDNKTENIKRYMQLVVEEFLFLYSSHVQNFKGDLSPFHEFENTIDQYFEI
jgi:hypothetical protein